MTAVRGDHPSLIGILSMQLFLFIQISITLLTGHFISERKRIIVKLEEGELRFRAVANSVPAGVFQLNHAGEITYLTNRWSDLTGYSLEDTLGKHIFTFVHPDDRENLKDQLAQVNQMGGVSSEQFRLIKPDQTFIWVQCNFSSFSDSPDGLTRTLGAFFDITLLKETEKNLASSEMLFRSFIDNLPDPAWLKDFDGRYQATNQANCDLYDLEFNDFYNKTDREIWGEEKALDYISSDRYVIDNKLPVRYESEVISKDHKRIWHEIVKTPLIKNGQVVGTTGIARDITDRRMVETALLDSEHRMKAILNNMPDLAWLKDTQDRFIAVNDVFCSTYNFKREDVIGKRTMDLFPPEIAVKFLNDDKEVIGIGRPKVIEEEVPNEVGHLSWYETIKMPIYDDRKNIVGITGIAREITNRKRAEESLQHRLDMEKVVTVIAARLNQLVPESPQADLLAALNDIGTYLQSDRCTFIVLDENFLPTDLFLEWTMPGVPDRELIVKSPDWHFI